jgi:hypothetical protein
MQLLIVHHDPEMGKALVQMVKNCTPHHCHLVTNKTAGMDWARRHQRCDLLLTQLAANGINGLVLGSALSEIFSGLQVLFFQITPPTNDGWKLPTQKFFRSRSRATI